MEVRISVCSPPHREGLVAELFFGNSQFAEIARSGNTFAVEIYAKKDSAPWVLSFDQLMDSLIAARDKLDRIAK